MKQIHKIASSLLLLVPTLSWAADHFDSPHDPSDVSADIADFYGWMDSDGEHLNLIITVASGSTEASRFSDAIQYVFHVNSSPGYGEESAETEILCQFDAAQEVSCWVGDGTERVQGNASDAEGLLSESGKLRVFAGLRRDPFFFNFAGFSQTVAAVVQSAPNLEFDAAGCPQLDEQTSAALVGQLGSGPDGSPAANAFERANVLSLVVQVNKTLLTTNGPVLGLWGSTHEAGGAAR